MTETHDRTLSGTFNLDQSEPLLVSKHASFASFYKQHPDQSANANFGKVLYMSTCFLVLFTAATGAQTLTAQLYQELHYATLGKLNQSTVYGVFCLAALLTPGLTKNWGYKNGVFIGSLGFIFTLIAGAMTASCEDNKLSPFCQNDVYVYAVNLSCSVLNGLTAPILWTFANRYVTSCANESNKGKYLGTFSSFVFAAGVAGSILGAIVIPRMGTVKFYYIASGLTLLAITMIFLAPNVPKYGEQNGSETVFDKIKSMARMAPSRQMRPLLPFFFCCGFLLAVYYGFEYNIVLHAIPGRSQSEQDEVTATVMLVEGIMTVVASFSAGKLADSIKRISVIYIYLCCGVLALVTSFMSYQTQSLFLAYVMASFWGIAYSGGYTMANIIVSKDFEGSSEAFNVYNFLSTLATSLGFGLCVIVKDIPTFLCIAAVILVLTKISVFFFKQKDELVAKEDFLEKGL